MPGGEAQCSRPVKIEKNPALMKDLGLGISLRLFDGVVVFTFFFVSRADFQMRDVSWN